MQQIHSKNTRPELRVRSILHCQGYHFRVNQKGLPGSPDIVLPRQRTILLINGCFWHQHPGCKLARLPKSNLDFWIKKLERNVERDKDNIRQLKAYGWKVFIIWECQVNRKTRAAAFVEQFLASNGINPPGPRIHVTQLSLFES